MRMPVLIAVLLIGMAVTRVFSKEEIKRILPFPSEYLEPPPAPTNHDEAAASPASKHNAQILRSDLHDTGNQINSKFTIPKFFEWFWPMKHDKQILKPADPRAASSPPINRNFANRVPYFDPHCNPCNSAPWIPIFGIVHPVAKLPEFPINVHPIGQQPFSPPPDPYYASFHEMSTNLIKPPIIPQPAYHPTYLTPTLYIPDHIPASNVRYKNEEFANQRPDLNPLLWNNCPNGVCFSSSASDNLQSASQSHHDPQEVYHPFGSQTINNSNWMGDMKPVPLSQYLLSVDYPMKIIRTPLIDVLSGPSQLPPSSHSLATAETSSTRRPSDLLVPHISNQQESIAGISVPHRIQNHLANPYDSQIIRHEGRQKDTKDLTSSLVSNTIDDSKFSSSESKTSSAFAVNDEDDDDDTFRTSESNPRLNSTTDELINYLTPPATSFVGTDWTIHEPKEPKPEKKKKQIQIVIPYTVDKNLKNHKIEPKSNNISMNAERIQPSSTSGSPILNYLRDNNGSSATIFGKASGAPNKKHHELTDLIRLQKAIDTWTVEGFSNHKYKPNVHQAKILTSTLSSSKEIPTDYFHVEEKRNLPPKITHRFGQVDETTKGSANESSKLWQKLPVSVSPLTNEKVYIVTPLPLERYNSSADATNAKWF